MSDEHGWRTQVLIWGWALTGSWSDVAALVEGRGEQENGRWWDLTQAELDSCPALTPRDALLPAFIGAIRRDVAVS